MAFRASAGRLDVSVLIVTYESEQWLDDCLRSLAEALPGLTYEVIVVDNASSDASTSVAERSGAKVLRNSVNVGFGAAVNQALASAIGSTIIVLNPDTRAEPRSLSRLVQVLDEDPSIALASACLMNEDGTPTAAVERYFRTFLPATLRLFGVGRVGFGRRRLIRPLTTRTIDVPWMAGACLALRRADAELLRGFDERFFLYQEDMDICLRAHRLGRVVVVGDAPVFHYCGGSSTGSPAGVKARRLAESDVTFVAVHSGWLAAWAYVALLTLRYAPNTLIERVLRRPPHYAPTIWASLRAVIRVPRRRPEPVAGEVWPTEDRTGVLALILTYNAPLSLVGCLTAIAAQTRRPERVLVVDNAGRHLAEATVRGIDLAGMPVDVMTLPSNGGPAGGHADGLRRFLASELAFAWVLDDDIIPAFDCLARMLSRAEELPHTAVLFPRVIEPDRTISEFPAWCGVLIPRGAVTAVGVPRRELFWWAEDTEYLQWRLPRCGISTEWVDGAFVEHHHVRDSGVAPPWKVYYETRNSTYYRLYVQHGRHWRKLLRMYVRVLGRLIAERGDRPRRLTMFARGIADGVFRRLGTRVSVEVEERA